MIQMITGFCSLINGGYYYEPHMVSKITAADGSVVKNIEPRLLKQTISAETSEKIREYCVQVVEGAMVPVNVQSLQAIASAVRLVQQKLSAPAVLVKRRITSYRFWAMRPQKIHRSQFMWF